MVETLTPYVILNGVPVSSPNIKRSDGAYYKYNLGRVETGQSLVVATHLESEPDERWHELVKTDDSKDALEGWRPHELVRLSDGDGAERWARLHNESTLGCGAVRLALKVPNHYGASFLTRGSVLQEGHEIETRAEGKLGISVIRSLGEVTRILDGLTALDGSGDDRTRQMLLW